MVKSKRKSPSRSCRKSYQYRKNGRCVNYKCKSGQVRDQVTKKCRSPKSRGRPKSSKRKSRSPKRKSPAKKSRSRRRARTPCKSNQVRDRVTKRCRAKKSRGRPKSSKRKSSSPKRKSPAKKSRSRRHKRTPCKSNQVRDPLTKKCRKSKSRASPKSKKRNRSTGRCRNRSGYKGAEGTPGAGKCINLATMGKTDKIKEKWAARKVPPYNAKDCKGQEMQGNDGNMYKSKKNAAGNYQWFKQQEPLDFDFSGMERAKYAAAEAAKAKDDGSDSDTESLV